MSLSPTTPSPLDRRFGWYPHVEAGYAIAALGVVLLGVDQVPTPVLAVVLFVGGLIAMIHIVALIADATGGDR